MSKPKVKTPPKKTDSNKLFVAIVLFLVVAIVIVLVVARTTSSSDKRSRERNSEVIKEQEKYAGSKATDGNYKNIKQEVAKKITFTGDALPALSQGQDTAVGLKVPIITAQNFSGKSAVINNPGKPYLLVFMAHWCPHCNSELPILRDLNGQWPKDFEIIAVSTGVSKDQVNYPPSSWFINEGWTYKVFLDDEKGTAINSTGGSGYPHLVFVDANGAVTKRLTGEQEASTVIAAANEAASK